MKSRMITAEEYFAAMSVKRSDLLARTAFRDLVARIVRPGACIFDFGAGPGIDAKYYAESGYRVLAYDHDPEMRRAFRMHCAAEMRVGSVRLYEASYREFLNTHAEAVRNEASVDLVTANFAPLNLVDDLPELFRCFSALTAAHGQVLVSVLSPYFVGDMRYGWWWRNRVKFWREREFAVPGATSFIHRRAPQSIAKAALPCFRLRHTLRGLPQLPRAELRSAGVWSLRSSQYLFLLLSKE